MPGGVKPAVPGWHTEYSTMTKTVQNKQWGKVDKQVCSRVPKMQCDDVSTRKFFTSYENDQNVLPHSISSASPHSYRALRGCVRLDTNKSSVYEVTTEKCNDGAREHCVDAPKDNCVDVPRENYVDACYQLLVCF